MLVLSEHLEERPHQLLVNRRVETVHDALPLALGGDETGRAENAQVMGDGGKGHGQLFGDFAGRAVARGEQLEDSAPGRVGQGTEDAVING
jgi:hypothetical protein